MPGFLIDINDQAIFASFSHVNYQKFVIVKQFIQNSNFHNYEVIIND